MRFCKYVCLFVFLSLSLSLSLCLSLSLYLSHSLSLYIYISPLSLSLSTHTHTYIYIGSKTTSLKQWSYIYFHLSQCSTSTMGNHICTSIALSTIPWRPIMSIMYSTLSTLMYITIATIATLLTTNHNVVELKYRVIVSLHIPFAPQLTLCLAFTLPNGRPPNNLPHICYSVWWIELWHQAWLSLI